MYLEFKFKWVPIFEVTSEHISYFGLSRCVGLPYQTGMFLCNFTSLG